jgi:ADP-ribose pyrophosphatase
MSGIPPDPPPFPPFPVESTERLVDSHWCGLRRDRFRNDAGELGDYYVFEVAAAVVVVPVLEDGSIVLLWQYRHPIGETHWEVPAGRIDAGESPTAAAERELLEETGYRAGRLVELAGFHPITGISPHHAQVFVAEGCVREREPEHDPTERISVHVLPPDEVRARLLRGDFVDGFSALALHQHLARPQGDRR